MKQNKKVVNIIYNRYLIKINCCRERIERFIDENKALMKRMYGDFEMNPGYRSSEPGHRTRTRRKSRDTRRHDIPDGGPNDELHAEVEIDEEYFSKNRNIRQSFGKNRSTESGRYRLGIEILI